MSPCDSDFFPDWAREAAIVAAGWGECIPAEVSKDNEEWERLNKDEFYYFRCFLKMAGWTGKRGQPRVIYSGRNK